MSSCQYEAHKLHGEILTVASPYGDFKGVVLGNSHIPTVSPHGFSSLRP